MKKNSEPQGVDIQPQQTRRDFIYVASGAMVTIGAGFATWPLIDQMNPAADTLALSTIEVDLSQISSGQETTVLWRKRPLFIWHRNAEQIAAAETTPLSDLIDPETDQARVKNPEWLVVIGVCTHLGCVPMFGKGPYGGYLCPCHGSIYDTSGRVRRGPAPRNLDVPTYSFLTPTTIKVG